MSSTIVETTTTSVAVVEEAKKSRGPGEDRQSATSAISSAVTNDDQLPTYAEQQQQQNLHITDSGKQSLADEDADEIAGLMMKAKSQESVCDAFSLDYFFNSLPQDMLQADTKQSLFKDLLQTQLALWTFTLSIVCTYCWQRRVHVRSFITAAVLINLSMLASCGLLVTVLVSHAIRGRYGSSSSWRDKDIVGANTADGAGGSQSGFSSPRGSSTSSPPRSPPSYQRRGRAGSFGGSQGSLCCSCHGSGASTPRASYAGIAATTTSAANGASATTVRGSVRFWQRKVSTDSAYYGRTIRAS